jgi:hypothetical protein
VLPLQQGPVVLISSRLGLVCVPLNCFGSKSLHSQEARFFRRYARKLPSSLTRDHSSTLACSASPPVSVCGTGACILRCRPFSPAQVLPTRGGCCHPHSCSPLRCCHPTSLNDARLVARHPPLYPTTSTFTHGAGITTSCPSVVTSSHGLRPD